ncbi:hypothetical protein KSF_108410 [Reticulibacter mediterranei]|uniref:Uncharacterized protein n=1 Tax=Reticulibacter mediterranei TaxID=2778369 RepID=A0A8J3N9H5_9CHLR|nr:HEAT repeat domain-containing protein [Reticulibacter mediterranei]GHP00794.1 hypothetical protein KSF_108410 [Reticulibacter mediterranei]
MPDIIETLKQRIDEAEHSDDVVVVLTQLAPLLVEDPSSKDRYDLLVDAFHALQTLTSEWVLEGEHVILTYLLDYLEQDSYGTSVQQSTTRQLRECLEAWIAQYADRESVALRERILSDLLLRFQARPSLALCWTFAHIGYREEQVVTTLWNYSSLHADDTGEAALVTLTALGVPLAERPRLLEALHAKMRRQVTHPLLIALHRLADPTSFDVLRETCFSPHHPGQINIAKGTSWFALHVLTHITDINTDDEDLQNRVWTFIAERYTLDPQSMLHPLNLGSGIAPHCDSRQVIPTVLTWIGQATDKEKLQHALPTLPYLLEECVCPRQLTSWQQEQMEGAIPVLREVACQDTHSTGRYATREMHMKEAAWGTLLCMGHEEALGWFEEAVSKETNPYMRGKLCDLFACFSLNPLPPGVLTSILEHYDAPLSDTTGEVAGSISVRLGAVKVAQSAASKEAFEALLACGLTMNGNALLASVNALSEVARSLARRGELTWVTEQLVRTIMQHSRPTSRLAAARALDTLAGEQELPAALLLPLVDILLSHNNRDPFERSILLSTFALPQVLPDALLPQVKQWAQERDDALALHSFSLLAERGLLLTEQALLSRLELPSDIPEGTATPILPRPDWRAHVVGLLYLSHPEMFTSRVADLIKTLPLSSAAQLFGKLRVITDARRHQPLPTPLADALIERVGQRQTRAGAELDLIRMAASLIPEDLALQRWDRSWQDWLPEARATMADALGTLQDISGPAATNRVQLLQFLISDGHYGVRRAAYRGLQKCASPLLQEWCWTWATSPQRMLRLRAAEAWAWLLPEGEQGKISTMLFHLLATDPEPEVREAAMRTHQERRKRWWAQWYLPRMMQVLQQQTASSAEVLAAWPYAKALERVGDDTTIRTLRTALLDQELPTHLRHWCQLTLKTMSEGWEQAMKHWPQPATQWTGSLEKGHGFLVFISAKRKISVEYAVWRDDPESPAGVASWGGTFQTENALDLSLDTPLLRMEDGRQGKIFIETTNGPGGSNRFVGQGTFPH